ncbi:MAG: Sigma-54 factor family [Pseudomonadota bacterium]|nr:RNA polymerase factor sigma-54 [Nitrosomonas sp.]
MKPTLTLKQTTSLTLTPQLQHALKLLTLSTLELNREIERMIQENPMLELDDHSDNAQSDFQQTIDSSMPDVADEPANINSPDSIEMTENDQSLDSFTDFHEDDNNIYQQQSNSHETDSSDLEFSRFAIQPISLCEHLLTQLSMSQLSERQRQIVSLLIHSLDEDGYLTQDIDELLQQLSSELVADRTELQAALEYLQQLDPPGVGASTLRECLSLQIRALPADTPCQQQALELVENHLEIFAAKNFRLLQRILGCNEACLQGIQQLITQLNPKPGGNFNSTLARYVVPDIIVVRSGKSWLVQLNQEATLSIHINQLYADILKNNRNEAARPLRGQLQEARWLIRNIRQRVQTILRVGQAIVDRQQAFLEQGETAVRPLAMREIAETLELHESTISRVTSHKYMRTPHGIFEFKYFFGSHVSTAQGDACSSIAIRGILKQLIQNENPKKPLSDNCLSQLMEQQGVIVARRTIAKYRELMHIPPTNLRKML